MFSSRRSMKSSSSENEGEEIQTPTNKGVRVPFQDVLPQCNVQRDVKNPCIKRRSEILPGSNLTPLMRRLHLQDDGLPGLKLVYEDPGQNIFVEEDCVCVPQARALTPLMHTAEPGLDSTVPEIMLIEAKDPTPGRGREEAITCVVRKGEPVIIEAKQEPKLPLNDTAIISGLAPGGSSNPIETVAGPNLGPRVAEGHSLSSRLEMAGQPEVPQRDCPPVLTGNSCTILPEVEGDDGLGEDLLDNLTTVHGLSVPLGTGTVGVGMLSCSDLGQLKDVVRFGELKRDGEEVGPWKMEAKQDDRVSEEVGRVSTGQIDIEGDWAEMGKNMGVVGQGIGDNMDIKHIKGERQESGQLEFGQEEGEGDEVMQAEREEGRR
ncbi:uncharacterized protein LOC132830215 [Hemiscyllium ocellatum]|uniref:uncharacterized protein LOC132830215 n=1 Tax=Hemiscyllium ocellatum TaxID=170820 RepID=UPI0029668B3B|nr:uncharacterized protein LOC132830215 [Hemiscyllium ocellatum]